MNTKANANWKWWHTAVVIAVVLVVVLLDLFGRLVWDVTNPSTSQLEWAILALSLLALVITVGHGVTGNAVGALIDQNNKMRLSRLQLIVWTIVILSAWLAAALWNIAIGTADPLGISLPIEVWGLLGISTASLVGTALVHNVKSKKDPPGDQELARIERISRQRRAADSPDQLAFQLQVDRVRNQQVANESELSNARLRSSILPADKRLEELQRVQVEDKIAQLDSQKSMETLAAEQNAALGITNNGELAANTSPNDASPADLFTGDDVGNDSLTDISKVQLFLFTLILVIAYASAIGTTLGTANPAEGIHDFPSLDAGMLALLAISNTGYLAYKAVPHSAPTPN